MISRYVMILRFAVEVLSPCFSCASYQSSLQFHHVSKVGTLF
jgi:hypothetical protein